MKRLAALVGLILGGLATFAVVRYSLAVRVEPCCDPGAPPYGCGECGHQFDSCPECCVNDPYFAVVQPWADPWLGISPPVVES